MRSRAGSTGEAGPRPRGGDSGRRPRKPAEPLMKPPTVRKDLHVPEPRTSPVTTPTAELGAVTIDCPDPAILAAFYAAALGGTITRERSDSTIMQIVCRRVDPYEAPAWPPRGRPCRSTSSCTSTMFTRPRPACVSLGPRRRTPACHRHRPPRHARSRRPPVLPLHPPQRRRRLTIEQSHSQYKTASSPDGQVTGMDETAVISRSGGAEARHPSVEVQ
jgi:hypothetical protein